MFRVETTLGSFTNRLTRIAARSLSGLDFGRSLHLAAVHRSLAPMLHLEGQPALVPAAPLALRSQRCSSCRVISLHVETNKPTKPRLEPKCTVHSPVPENGAPANEEQDVTLYPPQALSINETINGRTSDALHLGENPLARAYIARLLGYAPSKPAPEPGRDRLLRRLPRESHTDKERTTQRRP